ncbi:MAG: hypothetical protein U0520_05075 [Candidatus Saccharimonadales bacterium]
MSTERITIVGSVPLVADGNPATLLALDELARNDGLDFTALRLSTVSAPARFFHKGVSADPARAEHYVLSSEEERAGLKGRLFGTVAAAEFAVRHALFAHGATHWDVVQELPLLTIHPLVLSLLGIKTARLMVPDVYPKESGVAAVEKHKKMARFSVWNADAAAELQDRGFEVDFTQPYLLSSFRPEKDDFSSQGLEVIMKTSGSGAPEAWIEEIICNLERGGVQYAVHTPEYRMTNGRKKIVYDDFNSRIKAFYDDLGGKTRMLIGYPTELVGVVCEMRERDVDCWMVTLPPRGAHELRNREFGFKHDVIHSGLLPNSSHEDVYGLPRAIRSNSLCRVLEDTGAPSLPDGLIGADKLW